MKKVLLLTVLCTVFGLTVTVTAQKPYNPKATITAPMVKMNFTGNETLAAPSEPSVFQTMLEQSAQAREIGKEVWVGTTDYDLQTNSSGQNRLNQRLDGGNAAVWIYGTGDLAAGVPDRGTGYNLYLVDDEAWGDTPDARLEASTRTGWPNLVVTTSGTEFIVTHSAANELHTLRRENNETDWTEGNVPTNVTPGLLWPKATASGETIHVIAVSTPTGNGGTEWLGMNPALLYWRSPDGGETWDIQDFQIPGTTNAEFTGFGADSYVIDANDNGDVAIGIFSDWADVVILKSEDNGDTWNKRVVNDFPLDLYVVNSLYTIDDIGGVDLNGPAGNGGDSLSVFTSDGTGSVAVGDDGMAHVVFGHMYLADTDSTDAGWIFYPGWTGMSYWNESMADGAHQEIIEVSNSIDLDGNDTLSVTGAIASYFTSLTSMPNLAIDSDGTLMLTWSMLMEDVCTSLGLPPCNVKEESTPAANQHYRHVWLTASKDNGLTWQPPYNTNNEDVVLFPILLDQRECVYPDVHANGGGDYALYYQIDNEPGIHVSGDADPVNSNTLAVWNFNINDIFDFGTNTEEVVAAADLKFGLNPNPANAEVEVRYRLSESGQTTLTVSNMIGQQLLLIDQGNQNEGDHTSYLNVSNLSAGVYIVNLRANNKIATQKLVIKN